MLLNLSFSNAGSFVDKADLSFRLTPVRDAVLGWDRVTKSGKRVSTVMAAIGPNGSGKTTMLEVGSFLSWFIHDSFDAKPDARLPFMHHMLHGGEPSHFELAVEDSAGTHWDYSLVTTNTKVLSESLKRRPLGANLRTVFSREWSDKTKAYVVTPTNVEGLPRSEAVKVRGNASLISWARQYGVEIAPGLLEGRAVTNLRNKMRTWNGEFASIIEAANAFQLAPSIMERAKEILLYLDLGLTDIQLQMFTQGPKPGAPNGGEQPPSYYPVGTHSEDSGAKEFTLPFWLESAGTRSAFVLLRYLLEALETGAPAFIDEFDAALHPLMLEPLLRLFNEVETNPHGAQLIITVQNPDVLTLLKPPQVTFVEKVNTMSTAYRGDSIEGLKASDNIYSKYMAGALGAVPQI